MGGRDARAAAEPTVSIARAVVYRFLGRCFSFPDVELLKLFDGESLTECLDGWRALGLDVAGQMEEITTWLGSAGGESALQELQLEYTRLFVNAYPRIPTPPYSSVYLGEDRLVWGQSTAQAARLYEAAGLHLAEDFAEIPDHIAAEMEFASYLIVEQQRKQGDSCDSIRGLAAIEEEFLSRHLFQWAPTFFGRVAECSRIAFYRLAAGMARRFIEWDVRHLARD